MGIGVGVGLGAAVAGGGGVAVFIWVGVGVAVAGGVATGVGSWVGFAGCVRTGWLSDGAVASGSGVSVGVIMDVGTVSEQATRISRASRAVDSSFAMSVDSPFWSVSNSHRFGALSMLQKAFDLTRTVLESTKDFGLRRGSNGDWAIVVSLMLGRTSESLDAVKLLLCRHLVASRTRPASAAPRPTIPAWAGRRAES